MLNNGKTIKIQIGKVNQPVIEEIKDEGFFDTAVFGSQYSNMLSMLNQFVKYRKTEQNCVKEECANNIFAFVGDRGSGKTSCMSSVSTLLMSDNLKNFTTYPDLKDAKFASIDIIDPSYFDETHNIVATMVAKLYKSYQEKTKENHGICCDFDEDRNLTEAFFHAQHSLRCLLDKNTNTSDDFDDIEKLSELSLAVDLKNDIRKLVDSYLKFVKKEGGFLVLSIDDIDLNLSEADTMAEQIRKYLVSPNIIILFAAKLDQLATIKKLHYSEKYEMLIRTGELHFNAIDQMTSQFLTKFVPHDQRVYMPETEYILESGIEINGDNLKGNSVRQAVPELIFNRTRYLFYNSKQTPSYIVPRNLRKLCQLAAMLWTMCSYDDDTTPSTNQSIFRTYLFGPWMQDNLSVNDRERINKILEGWKNDQLNSATIEVIREKYKAWFDEYATNTTHLDKLDTKGEIVSLFDNRNHEYNISVGDIASLISILQDRFEAHTDKCFFFILNAIYSIALYEKYDLITDIQDKDSYKENEDPKAIDDGRVLLYDPFTDELVHDYHKLVAGRFYNYRLATVMPKEQLGDALVSRSDRIINLDSLMKLIEECVVDWNEYNSMNAVAQGLSVDALRKKVRLAEFFMLCCIRDISTQNRKKLADYYEAEFRQSDTVTYNGEFTGIKNIYFDLGAFFYNITNIRSCYRRFKQAGKDFFELCYSEKGYHEKKGEEMVTKYISLYSSFKHRSLIYRGNGYKIEHAWQSWASIRNMEILSDLNQHLRAKCLKTKGSNRHIMYSYFNTLSEYSIRTYDRNDKDGYLSISFEFADSISNILSDPSIESDFNKIFNMDIPVRKNEKEKESIMTMDPSLLIDTRALLKGRSKDRNRKITILKFLEAKQTKVYTDNEILVRTVFDGLADYLTKEEIKQAAGSLNALIIAKYGNTKGHPEDTVSSTDTESSTPDVEG